MHVWNFRFPSLKNIAKDFLRFLRFWKHKIFLGLFCPKLAPHDGNYWLSYSFKSHNCHQLMLARYIYAVRNNNENKSFKICELSTLLWVHWPTGSAWLSHSPSLISWSPFCHRLVIGRVACFKQLSLSYKFSDKWKRKFYSQSINEMKQVREPNYLLRSKRQLQFNLTTYNTPY